MKQDGTFPLKLSVIFKRQTILLSTGVSLKPQNWDGYEVVGMPNARLTNMNLRSARARLEDKLLEYSGKIETMSVTQMRNLLSGREKDKTQRRKKRQLPDNHFETYFKKYCERCRKPKTAEVYMSALRKVENFTGEDFASLTFEDINKEWLSNFQKWMLDSGCSLNTCNIHFRTIRAVFNDAIDNDVTQNYPFRKFKMKRVRTRKRSLKVEELRELFDFPCEPEQQKWLDIFKLTFMLIGINMVDLYNLKTIKNGRVDYTRSKTYRPYSIKVEPEAMELIKKYRGKRALIDIADRWANHENYTRRLNRALKAIGPVTVGKYGKKERQPLHPEISTYWARHTWATIAASLDIPKETIAAALGHGGNTVTDIYIDFDTKKIDEANRKVLDWVLYGKK